MIKVFATGNIGKDAEVRQVSEKANVVSFSIASTEKYKDEKKTTWLNCQKWNAEKLSPYLTKGTRVEVEGDLEIREHEGKYFTTLNISKLEFGGSASAETKRDNAPDVENDEPDLPF